MSVADPVIDYLDLTTKHIFLLTGIREYHPVDDIYREIRNLRRTDESYRVFDMPVKAFGAVPKGGGKFTPRYAVFYDGWTIVPEDVSHSLYISGEQITSGGESGPACLDLTVLSPGTNVIIHYEPPSAELIKAEAEIAAINRMKFNQKVYVDINNGTPGTEDPIGDPSTPVDNIPDANIIASNYSFKTFEFVHGEHILDTGDNVSFKIMIGDDPTKVVLDIKTGAVCDDTTFRELFIKGILDGGSVLRRCYIGDISYLNGFIHESYIDGTVSLGGSVPAVFLNCWGSSNTVLDMLAGGQNLTMIGYSGTAKITNLSSSTTSIEIFVEGGCITLDSTITQGDIHISGTCKFINNTTPQAGLTIDTDGLNNKEEISSAVIDYDLTGYDTHKTFGGIQVRSAYNDKIEVNILGGGAGSSFPVGMEHQPVDNIPDALLLLEQFHFNKLRINDDVPIPESTNLNGITFISGATIDRKITIPATCTTNGTKFKNVILDGNLNGRTDLSGCILEEVFGFRGNMSKCTIETGLTVDDSTGQTLHIHDCAGGGGSYLDIGSAAAYVTNFTGVIEIINKDSSNLLGMHLNGAVIIIADTCTDGMIMLTGEGTVIDNSGPGCIVDSSRVVNKTNFISYLEKIINNKREVKKNGSVWELVVYDDDNITPILTKILKDKDTNDITDLLTGVLAQELANSV